ncbi:MAG: DegV family EDD domain-containing protein [Oscillospiraceae bacterium]|nr:DegV family EDD domain-containing protein [Oscillospiraceae bacterium]
MMSIILMAETGSDITTQLAAQYGIKIVPMHVSFDSETLDDGAFPVQKIVDYYKLTGRLPKTSGSTPQDFEKAFDEVHKEHPEAHILYLAYSAVTTCSYQSAIIASEGRDYVTAIDTKQVSIGQAAIVVEMAKELSAKPDMSIAEAVEKAQAIIARGCMCFLPDNLEFLRAGGRVSNAVSMASRILSIHPCIELLEGKLMATKKYRGKMVKVAAQLIHEYSVNYDMDRGCLWLVYTIGLSDEVKNAVKQAAEECGFKKLQWIQAHGVITTHGGPAAFGIAGLKK